MKVLFWIVSRVNGVSHPGSDLDLVVIGKEKLPWQLMARLKGAFEESDLPFTVDLLDWHAIPENFRKSIQGKHEVLREAPESASG
jgi:uncharacterized protein